MKEIRVLGCRLKAVRHYNRLLVNVSLALSRAPAIFAARRESRPPSGESMPFASRWCAFWRASVLASRRRMDRARKELGQVLLQEARPQPGLLKPTAGFWMNGGLRVTGVISAAAVTILFSGCGSPPKMARLDPVVKREAASAETSIASGSWEKAAAHYSLALRRARQMDDPIQIAAQAYGLAACRAQAGDYEAARALIDEGLSEARRAGAPVQALKLLQIRVARLQKRLDEAQAMAMESVQAAEKAGDKPFAARLRVMLAQIACEKGDSVRARMELKTAQPLLKKLSDDDALMAEYRVAQAAASLAERQYRDAAGQYDAAARLLRKAGRYGDMALVLEVAAQAWADADEPGLAADRWHRSARISFAAGEIAHARDLINNGLPLATEAGDKALQAAFERLNAEIGKAAAAPAPGG